MTHVTLRPEFETLIDPYAPVGQVGTGFDFTEGPIWHPVHHYCCFRICPAMYAGDGMPGAASSRPSGRRTNATA